MGDLESFVETFWKRKGRKLHYKCARASFIILCQWKLIFCLPVMIFSWRHGSRLRFT